MNASCPLSRSDVVDRYFLEHRAKLLDVAAFLDRVDRGGGGSGDEGGADFRMDAFRRAVKVLSDPGPNRARTILELLSDPTDEPIDSAAGLKGAFGAWPGKGPSA